ncbi:HTH APSES-type domain-containing protein [Trichoderma simmonsii]|uniref:HTH APSES-type domain-containing protein n=1 Tax=Trichoderma simmonsii TaxID=1491479 RepID=A0A8G0PA41_9HYPO|nr:HTH APSES-type domain-containing protein [Trichoderma simmonsii]
MPTNTGNRMLPLHSILNPALSGQPEPGFRQSDPVLATISTSLPSGALRGTTDGSVPTQKAKPQESAGTMPKPKLQGPVNFAPFEDVDQASYREVQRFQVSPFGQIRQSCDHIPYSSSKKDFFEKTGRESIEVFKYEFCYNEATYTVMWDYNVGLVRMTPFFKCLGYAKTKPSQMLDRNPGLRDISPSITGGAVSAQGYWMPYPCARAVCATFCTRIAGALIPLFGPSFPSQCTPSDSPYYNDMVISRLVIMQATEDVARFRYGQGQGNRIVKAVGGIRGPLVLGDYPLRGKRESQPTPSFRLPSRPQAPRSQRLITSIPEAPFGHHPMATSAPSTACEAHEVNPFSRMSMNMTGRSVLDPKLFQPPGSFVNMSPRTETSESERKHIEKWRPKRRRRARNESETTYSPAPLVEANEERQPQLELEHFRAAAALLSLHREPRGAENSSTIAVETSDDDFPERRHQKKRPKAHSF